MVYLVNKKKKINELKDLGLKATNPRMKILAVLEQADNHHVSAEDVYRILLADQSEISLATIYRVLTQFHEAGLVKRHNFENDHAVFELNNGSHHDHLICIKCNEVIEFIDEMIESQQEKIAKKFKFHLIDHALNLYGLCRKCYHA